MLSDHTPEQIIAYLKKELKPRRYMHSIGVAYTAASLAMAHGLDVEKALYAGLLHDVAKQYSGKDLLACCDKNHIEVRPVERCNPQLLHGKVGAYLAQKVFHVKDPEVLEAIVWHTTGKPEMSDLEKVLYIADYIEPGREELECMEVLRTTAFADLNKAVYIEADAVLRYIRTQGKEIDYYTEETCNYYSRYRQE